MSSSDLSGLWEACSLSIEVALCATLLALVPATLAGFALARFEFPLKPLVSALVLVPMMLPPTAVGYLLLHLFADRGPLGRTSLGLDLGLLFTWRGAVMATTVMAFPVMVRTARASFELINPKLEHLARTLGCNAWQAVWRVSLPLARRGLLAAGVLGFLRAFGEFGATVMLAGNIPGQTRTLASAIFAAQQTGQERFAFFLIGIALVVGVVAAMAADWLVTPAFRSGKPSSAPETRPAGTRPGASEP